ncbi:MAG: DNA polymerase III subunit chi [Pseudohongiellaceae bacterium]
MPSVHFYTLNPERYPSAEDTLGVACRLTEKAVNHSHSVYILTKSLAESIQLDDLLWQFKSTSFIPHGIYNQDQKQSVPVLLGHSLPPDDFRGMVINLSNKPLDPIDQFERINELVGGDDMSLAQGRERYRAYRSHGVEIVTNKI